ncbi:uncharacterized protein O9250_007358 [Rhynochetos jubatus]
MSLSCSSNMPAYFCFKDDSVSATREPARGGMKHPAHDSLLRPDTLTQKLYKLKNMKEEDKKTKRELTSLMRWSTSKFMLSELRDLYPLGSSHSTAWILLVYFKTRLIKSRLITQFW